MGGINYDGTTISNQILHHLLCLKLNWAHEYFSRSVFMRPFFMARKKNEYRVNLGNEQTKRIQAYWWHRYIASGWLVRVGNRLAKLRDGVIGWLEDGKLRLLDTKSGVGISIPSSWRLVERQAIYDQRGAVLTPLQMQREIWAQYVTT